MTRFNIKNNEQRLIAKNEFDGNLVFGAKKFHASTNRSGGSNKPSDGGLTREHSKVIHDTQTDRYQRRKDIWEDVEECPVCKSNKKEYRFSRLGIDIYRCIDCTHQYMHPRLKPQELGPMYSDDKTSADIYTSSPQIQIDTKKYNYGLSLIDQLDVPNRDKILDVGCGSGLFLDLAYKQGWRQCVGVDINDRYEDCYRAIDGVQFISSTFEELSPEKIGSGYGCISMWGVLEHLYELDVVLQKQRNLLAVKGLLLILVPNAYSLATRLIREKSATFMWKHVSHFSPKSLNLLLERNGFENVHFETVVSEIDNVKSYMSGEYPYHGYGDPEKLFDFITPKYIHDNLLGSRILAVYRKI